MKAFPRLAATLAVVGLFLLVLLPSARASHLAPASRLQTVSTVLGGRTYTVSYGYYGDGKLQSLTTPAGTTVYSYDRNGRLVSMSAPAGETTTWTYDHIGRVTSESTTTTAGKAISTSYGWGTSGQAGDPSSAPVYLRSIVQTVNGSAFETYTLTHSYLGQLLSQQGSGYSGETLSYGFDGRGRLTSESESVQAGGQLYASSGSYTYDLANNLEGGANGWTYNSNDQATSAPAKAGLAGASGLGYDAAGSLTSANGMTLSYDPFGRVSSISGAPGGSVSFSYDYAGRRVSKTVNGVTTYYLYSGDMLVCELDASGNVLRSYNWGACGLVSDHSASGSRYYLFDRSGNTRALLDASGAVPSVGAYTAWGAALSNINSSTPFGYAGRFGIYTDTETGPAGAEGGQQRDDAVRVWRGDGGRDGVAAGSGAPGGECTVAPSPVSRLRQAPRKHDPRCQPAAVRARTPPPTDIATVTTPG